MDEVKAERNQKQKRVKEIGAVNARHAEVWDEVKKLLGIKKCIEDMKHQERTQKKERGIDR